MDFDLLARRKVIRYKNKATMKTSAHHFHIKAKGNPVIEYDPTAGAVYIRFSKNKVAKTVESRKNQDVFIDLDAKGSVIGIEALCMKELRLQRIEKLVKQNAGVDMDFSNSRIQLPEPAVA